MYSIARISATLRAALSVSPQPVLADMALFATVIAEGSFTAAARALEMPKSSVSRRIADLEASLGVALLTRTTRSLSPTEPGARFYAHCARIVAEADEAQEAIVAAAKMQVGVVRITAAVGFGRVYLGAFAAEALAKHPGLRLDIVLSNRVVDLVEEGFDVAVRIGKPLSSSSLVSRSVGRARRFLCASPDYLARRGAPASLEDLASHDLLRQGESGRPASWSLLGPEGEATVPVRGRLWSNHPNILLRAATLGLGIACLPVPVAGPERRAGRLVPVLAGHEPATTEVHLLYPSSRHMPARVRAVLDVLIPSLREQIQRLAR